MLKYAAKRLGMGLVTLFVLATATFFLMKAIPGSPFGAEVSQMSAAAVEKLYEKYDLDKSIPEQYVIYIKNVLHNAAIPILTIVALSIGSLLGGSVVVETIFRWPGIGKLVMDSITARDYPVIQGFVIFTSCIYVLINLAADLCYRRLDPRVGQM